MNYKPLFRYQLLLVMLSPWLLYKTVREAAKERSWQFLKQRFGFSYRTITGSPVWIHCASVGEVTAARPLIEAIQQRLPSVQLLLTTTTPTGAATVHRQRWENLECQFLPIDYRRSVKRLLSKSAPRALLILETEIWPNLILQAREQNVPVLIVNARLSKRTLSVPAWLKPVYKQVLPRLSAVLCKSSDDVARFQQLGANPEAISAIGNIKFSTADYIPTHCEISRPFWLAASTHEDEELLLCQALMHSRLIEKTLLVIAPRHPQRSAEIQKAIARCGLRCAVRSKFQLPDDDTAVYLADTLGEMNSWFTGAKLVFMGGSLVPVGGHNLLQPAAAGVPIVSGSYLENVPEEAALLLQAGAMQQVESATELITYVESVIDNAAELRQMSLAGQQVITQNSAVLNDYLVQILPFIARE